MCINGKQCCASISNGQRCTKSTISAISDHCSDHNNNAYEQYIAYKQICKVSDSKDVLAKIENPIKCIKHLRDCHTWLVRAFESRMDHHIKFYMPECSDRKHNKVFEIIKNKINICRTRIAEQDTFIKKQVKTEITHSLYKEEESFYEESSILTEVEEIVKEVAVFKKKQADSELLFDKLVKANILTNNKLAYEKRKAATLCSNLIKGQLDTEYNIFFNQVGIMNIIAQCYNIHYFSGYYQPTPCKNCSCNGYEPLQFRLGCSCLLTTDLDCVSYLCAGSITTQQLKEMCDVILTQLHKIKPIIVEYIQCYKMHGTKVLNRLITLTWEFKQDRLVLSSESERVYEKHSEYLASLRKRNSPVKYNIVHKVRSTQQWKSTLDELSEYVRKNEKLPPKNAKNKQTRELGVWFQKQFVDYKKETGMLIRKENIDCFQKFIFKFYKHFPEIMDNI